jgi:hypothetical protein
MFRHISFNSVNSESFIQKNGGIWLNHIKKTFLYNTKAKVSAAWVLIALIVVVVVVASVKMPKIDLGNLSAQFGVNTGGTTDTGQPVNRAIEFSFTDAYSGAAASTKTVYVYDADMALKHTLTTDSNGLCHTTVGYPSGTILNVKYVDGNSKIWYKVKVPTLQGSEVQASTYNPVALSTFTIGTYTVDALKVGGASINDNGEYNSTTSGANPIFRYDLANTGADNTGLMTSYDPIYEQDWQVWVVVSFSGTNYETIVLSGFDTQFPIGNTVYGCDQANAQALTLWKVGNNYKAGYEGTDSVSWSLDMTGYPATSSGVTMQIEVYAYASPAYAQAHGGNFGVTKLEIAEQTVTLKA